MISTGRAIVVEGRYDRERVRLVCDALVITTDGFNIRRDAAKRELIARLALERGIIILTDSDSAGFKIRRYVEEAAGEGGVLHAYIPDVAGKERRKQRRSSEGLLGVEGVSAADVERALADALRGDDGAPPASAARGGPVTAAELYADGLSGVKDASQRRSKLLRAAGLPQNMSSAAMLDALSRLYGLEGYRELLRSLGG